MTALEKLQQCMKNNYELLRSAGKAECVHCSHKFNVKERLETTDESTVICPNCGVDSVLPILTPKLMKKLNKDLFSI